MPILGDPRHPLALKTAQQKVLDGMTFLRARLRSLALGKLLAVCNHTTNTFTAAGHELVDDDLVCFRGSLPGGVVVSTVYYVVNSDRAGGTFQVSTSQGGAALDLLSSGGTFYVVRDGASQIGVVGALVSGGDTVSTLKDALALVGLLTGTQTWSAVNTFSAGLIALIANISTQINFTRTSMTQTCLSDASALSGDHKLFASLRAGSSRYVRVYLANSLSGIEFVVNAAWNGANWHKDDAAETFRLTLNTDGVRLDHLASDDTDTWDNEVWLLSAGNAKKNAVSPKNIIKACGVITTNGAGAATLLSGSYNIDTVAIDGTSVRVNLTVALGDTNYGIGGMENAGTARFVQGQPDTTTSFVYTTVRGSTDTADNMAAVSRRTFVFVVGNQT